MIKKRVHLNSLAVKVLMVLFWLAVICGFLFVPYLIPEIREKRSICMYSWSDRIDESLLMKFEAETGIKVYMNYYDSNEELLVKLNIMPESGCDIMLPSDYIIEELVKLKLLKKIDHARCNFVDRLYPELMSKFYDPKNEYSLPLYWDVMSIGYSTGRFPAGPPTKSWGMVFDRDQVPCDKIGMINDSRESICLLHKYLNLQDQTKETVVKMRNLLTAQKQWIGVYCDAQQGYFLSSGAYDIAVSQREYIARAMKDAGGVGCMIPEEGTLLTIDCVVLSAFTKKDDLIYQFLNFLYSHEVLSHNSREFCFLPAARDVYETLDEELVGIPGLDPCKLEEKNITVFRNWLPLKETSEFWIRIKSA
jgi:spermidine/putrescine transport system substrate-binding protein